MTPHGVRVFRRTFYHGVLSMHLETVNAHLAPDPLFAMRALLAEIDEYTAEKGEFE